jgi:act minimal PKS chain-length factor (CLF/KS beta)
MTPAPTTRSTPEATPPVVTGIGVAAPTGTQVAEHWQAVLAGKSGVGRITRFDPSGYPVRLAGEVPGFTPQGRIPGRLVPQTDRGTHFALYAAEQALADAGVNPATRPEYEMAVVLASSSGGTEFGQHEMERLYTRGPTWVGAYQSIAWFYAASTGQISIRHGMRGPCGVLCTEQAGGLDALGQARRLLRAGSGLVVAGGTDASLCPYGLVAQLSNGQLATGEDPERAYLPFDLEAAGHVPGEGGAILVVEPGTAPDRTDPGYGQLAGYAAGFDPDPERGRPGPLAGVIRRALADARLTPREIDVVFADAAGVWAADRAEAAALRAVFGPRGVPVTAPKTLTGRLYGGGAALDAATALLALRHQVLPPCVGPTRPVPGDDLDLVLDQPREVPLRAVLVLARGYQGFISALVLTRPAG